MSLTVQAVRKLFAPLAKPSTAPAFLETLADNLDWQIAGPNAKPAPFGSYSSRDAFVKGALGPVGQSIEGGGIGLVIEHEPIVAGEWATVELRAVGADGEPAKGKNGVAFDNRYAWVVRVVDDKIVQGRAYLDTRLVLAVLGRDIPRD